MVWSVVLFLIFSASALSKKCSIKSYPDGFVCVCNATYCDTIPELKVNNKSTIQLYTTSHTKPGFNSEHLKFFPKPLKINNKFVASITIDPSKKYQKILGFGGSFSDSSGFNIASLSQKTQKKLMSSYYGTSGIQYTLGRVPIAGTDKSNRYYSYDDHWDDFELNHFNLTEEDFLYKIPFIKQAKSLIKLGGLKLVASAWSAPAWMKNNSAFITPSHLKHDYYSVWARYHLRFFREYKKHGIKFWGVTQGNEPNTMGNFVNQARAPGMGFSPNTTNDWIGGHLGPAIRESEFKDLKILLFDDNIIAMRLLKTTLNNEIVLSYIDGIASHWYDDGKVPTSYYQTIFPTTKKELFHLKTESSYMTHPKLGNWPQARFLMLDIISELSLNVTGWIDWNLVLNPSGGPAMFDNPLDANIIANATSNEFYKQPMFYILGHFSKFIPPNSTRIDSFVKTGEKNNITSVAFQRPDGLITLVISNLDNKEYIITVEDQSRIGVITLQNNSINTAIFKAT